MDETIKRQLVEFITKRRREGAEDLAIQDELKTAGWETWMITNGFAAFGTTVKTGEARILTQEMEEGGSDGPLIEVADVGVMALMAQAWEYFKGRWKTLVGILLLPQLVWVGLWIFLFMGGVMAIFMGAVAGEQGLYSALPVIGVMVLIYSVGMILSMTGQIALYFGVSKKYENVGVFDAYKLAFSKIGAYFWLMLLSSLAILGGMTLLIIPGILVSLWFFMAVFVMVDEDLGGLTALTKSKFYMKNNLGYVFGQMLVVSVLVIIAYLVIMVVGGGLQSVVDEVMGKVIGGLVGGVFVLMAAPYMVVFQYLLFQNLKGKKRGQTFSPQDGKSAIVGLIIWAVVATVLGMVLMLTMIMSIYQVYRDFGGADFSPPRELREPVKEEQWDGEEVRDIQVD